MAIEIKNSQTAIFFSKIMRIPDLRVLNICLLASWIQTYYEAGDKVWRKIIDFKYSPEFPNIFYCNNRNCSPF
jgi:hypothetical protein